MLITGFHPQAHSDWSWLEATPASIVDIPVGYTAKVDVISDIHKSVCEGLYEDAQWVAKLAQNQPWRELSHWRQVP